MNIVGDTHTHTVACNHAMGTITENAQYAKRLGHRFVAITEHCCTLPYSPPLWYFSNILRNQPHDIDGVFVLKGAEVNIMNVCGQVDLPEKYLSKLDIIIASAHHDAFENGNWSRGDFTNMYCAVAANPLVDIIGHCGSPAYTHDYERAVQAYKQHDKIVEINSSSPHARPGSEENCREIIRLCKKYGVKIVASSDAHSPQNVGAVAWSLAELSAQDFPEELVVNANYDRFRAEFHRRRGVMMPE